VNLNFTGGTEAMASIQGGRLVPIPFSQMLDPSSAPATGAIQNSHNCIMAQPPTYTATPVLRAGFTEVFVTGIVIR